MDAKSVETAPNVVVFKLCQCVACKDFTNRRDEQKNQFEPEDYNYDFKLPEIVETNPKEFKFEVIANYLENVYYDRSNVSGGASYGFSYENFLEVLRFYVYGTRDNTPLLNQKYVVAIAEAIMHGASIEETLNLKLCDDKFIIDFLKKLCVRFVLTWTAFFKGCLQAENPARVHQLFLDKVVSIPYVHKYILKVFKDDEFWPENVGPFQTLEILCDKHRMCCSIFSFLCNLTRIDGMPEYLDQNTKIVQILKNQFFAHCRLVQDGKSYRAVTIYLWTNLARLESFQKFVIESNAGYFMSSTLPILLDDLLYHAIGKAIWPFLKNLSLTEEGRKAIMENADVLLGQILYPIAGPETITREDAPGLPFEVTDLPKTKTRVYEEEIRECVLDVLYSLCRYRKDREALRQFDVYQILKHYHLAETDPVLLEKIEDLVNILIRKEESEIEVNDLLDGLEESTESGDKKAENLKESPVLEPQEEISAPGDGDAKTD